MTRTSQQKQTHVHKFIYVNNWMKCENSLPYVFVYIYIPETIELLPHITSYILRSFTVTFGNF